MLEYVKAFEPAVIITASDRFRYKPLIYTCMAHNSMTVLYAVK